MQLYLDDGDGLFAPGAGDVQVGSDILTASRWQYAFESLDPAASYFVQRPAQALLGVMQPAQVSTLLSARIAVVDDRCVCQCAKGLADPR